MSSINTQTVSLLKQLVKIESINPSASAQGSGEQKVAEFLEAFCRERNLPFEYQEVTDGRANFFTWVPGQEPDRRVLFISHMDTVPVDNWEADPFSPDERDGRIYGRGSCDDKGPLAAMLMALSTLGERKPRATIVLGASVDEEYRKKGARKIAQSGVSYEAAVVGEPTDLELVVAHKGSVRWQVEVEGVPAHSSKPHLGVNAITGMAKVILALDKINETLSQRVHPLVSPPTLTITLIEGGTELATVPPSCRVWIDRRLIPGERPADALQEVENILEGLRKGPDKINVRSLLPALEDPAPPSAEATKIAAVAAKACAEVAGTGQHRGVPYGTDASQLSLGGIPCVILGPGSIDQAHTANEYVEIDQLTKAVEIYQKIMLSY
ncbi:MAG: M20 family peptidase [Mesorhizobium sp.]|uniref:M20 family metallopeptidase n=1 Tax=Mesorhizobium sp. TaxID=1871066 RepID=UPI000FE50BC7|nr:M20 family metallopeptidase [Mesorhizobium sp.]RWF88240.1 MAG: M20 family peptidase [Mesorhizobium sp.]RWJ45232.1 MAG: M20 family peptidase [Mesorhizobium sp.]RWJ58214.1 MAG: M20 family peptidase [Mesorhizobium sp.]RWJ61398.1 MAG: M20 family peptidase [Mesorhizobium sp.]RWJ91989.1 MAG: M20 family peptidase [Mesorhizobium sp.]